ncbi:MAG: hypothetical protein HY225_03750 [Candidatus Vogelbacteria bacterium]|nr:hypothetical protein [Candidatus Vogelbacteria bacterium]
MDEDTFDEGDYEEIIDIMQNKDVGIEKAREIKEVMDEWGLDEDKASELRDLL